MKETESGEFVELEMLANGENVRKLLQKACRNKYILRREKEMSFRENKSGGFVADV